MKKFLKTLGSTILAMIFIVGGFIGGFTYNEHIYQQPAEAFEPNIETEELDLQLPGETEKFIITVDEVESQLKDIGEISTYSGEYTITKGKEFFRNVLDDYKIPGTSNSITLTCTGIVKVGYDIDAINIVVDNDSYKIYITLPEPRVNDNYIIWDSVEYTEENNPLNPIEFAQYQSMIDEIEADGLKDVESKGIYEAAEKNIKFIIENFLADIPEYSIVFM